MGSLCVQSSSKPLLYTQHLASVLLPLDSCCLLFFCSAYSIPWVLISAISLSLAANTCWEFKAASPIETPRVPRSWVIIYHSCCPPFLLSRLSPTVLSPPCLSLAEPPLPAVTLPAPGCLYLSAGLGFPYAAQRCDPLYSHTFCPAGSLKPGILRFSSL